MRATEQMYAKVLSADFWRGAIDDGRDVTDPSLEDIAKAIKRLDGHRHTMAILKGDGEAYLAVGGGADGQYVVFATFDNKRFFTLMSPRQSDSKVLLCVGGQAARRQRPEFGRLVAELDADVEREAFAAEHVRDRGHEPLALGHADFQIRETRTRHRDRRAIIAAATERGEQTITRGLRELARTRRELALCHRRETIDHGRLPAIFRAPRLHREHHRRLGRAHVVRVALDADGRLRARA